MNGDDHSGTSSLGSAVIGAFLGCRGKRVTIIPLALRHALPWQGIPARETNMLWWSLGPRVAVPFKPLAAPIQARIVPPNPERSMRCCSCCAVAAGFLRPAIVSTPGGACTCRLNVGRT